MKQFKLEFDNQVIIAKGKFQNQVDAWNELGNAYREKEYDDMATLYQMEIIAVPIVDPGVYVPLHNDNVNNPGGDESINNRMRGVNVTEVGYVWETPELTLDDAYPYTRWLPVLRGHVASTIA